MPFRVQVVFKAYHVMLYFHSNCKYTDSCHHYSNNEKPKGGVYVQSRRRKILKKVNEQLYSPMILFYGPKITQIDDLTGRTYPANRIRVSQG